MSTHERFQSVLLLLVVLLCSTLTATQQTKTVFCDGRTVSCDFRDACSNVDIVCNDYARYTPLTVLCSATEACNNLRIFSSADTRVLLSAQNAIGADGIALYCGSIPQRTLDLAATYFSADDFSGGNSCAFDFESNTRRLRGTQPVEVECWDTTVCTAPSLSLIRSTNAGSPLYQTNPSDTIDEMELDMDNNATTEWPSASTHTPTDFWANPESFTFELDVVSHMSASGIRIKKDELIDAICEAYTVLSDDTRHCPSDMRVRFLQIGETQTNDSDPNIRSAEFRHESSKENQKNHAANEAGVYCNVTVFSESESDLLHLKLDTGFDTFETQLETRFGDILNSDFSDATVDVLSIDGVSQHTTASPTTVTVPMTTPKDNGGSNGGGTGVDLITLGVGLAAGVCFICLLSGVFFYVYSKKCIDNSARGRHNGDDEDSSSSTEEQIEMGASGSEPRSVSSVDLMDMALEIQANEGDWIDTPGVGGTNVQISPCPSLPQRIGDPAVTAGFTPDGLATASHSDAPVISSVLSPLSQMALAPLSVASGIDAADYSLSQLSMRSQLQQSIGLGSVQSLIEGVSPLESRIRSDSLNVAADLGIDQNVVEAQMREYAAIQMQKEKEEEVSVEDSSEEMYMPMPATAGDLILAAAIAAGVVEPRQVEHVHVVDAHEHVDAVDASGHVDVVRVGAVAGRGQVSEQVDVMALSAALMDDSDEETSSSEMHLGIVAEMGVLRRSSVEIELSESDEMGVRFALENELLQHEGGDYDDYGAEHQLSGEDEKGEAVESSEESAGARVIPRPDKDDHGFDYGYSYGDDQSLSEVKAGYLMRLVKGVVDDTVESSDESSLMKMAVPRKRTIPLMHAPEEPGGHGAAEGMKVLPMQVGEAHIDGSPAVDPSFDPFVEREPGSAEIEDQRPERIRFEYTPETNAIDAPLKEDT